MTHLIPWSSQYVYEKLERIDTSHGRVYKTENFGHVPSVTTILDRTKNKAALQDWAERVGHEEAARQKEDAAYIGTHMHATLESILTGEPLAMAQDWRAFKGQAMAYALAQKKFEHLSLIHGSEVNLHYEDRYAGTTDLVAVYRGRLAIVDFKQSVKPKRHEYITDYFHQLAAYADAHDHQHGTAIDYGVVLVAVQDGQVQEFTTTGREFADFRTQWRQRVVTAARLAAPASD